MKVKYRAYILENVEPKIGYKPTHKEIADILFEAGLSKCADKTRNALGNRWMADGWLSSNEKKAINEHYFYNLSTTQRGVELMENVCEIPYWEGCKNCIQELTSPRITRPIIVDKDVTIKEWERKPENLRIIAMPDNRMDGEPLYVKRTNILFIDIADTNYANGGIYFYISKDKIAGVARIRVDMEGNVIFSFDNPLYNPKKFTIKQLEELKFKIIGRMVCNYSRPRI